MPPQTVPQLDYFHALLATLVTSTSNMGLFVGLVSCVLLALVAGLLLAVGQQLRQVRQDMGRAPLLAEDLTRQLMQARTAMTELQKAAKEAAPAVEKSVGEAGRIRQELNFVLERAEQVAAKLEAGTGGFFGGVVQQPASGQENGKPLAAMVAAAYGTPVLPGAKRGAALMQPEHDPLEDLISTLNATPAGEETLRVTRSAKNPGEKASAKKRSVSQAELDLKEKLAAK